MAFTIATRNVHQAIPAAVQWLSITGVGKEGSDVLAPTPLCFALDKPHERVAFWDLGQNPFSDFASMLAGTEDRAPTWPIDFFGDTRIMPRSNIGALRAFANALRAGTDRSIALPIGRRRIELIFTELLGTWNVHLIRGRGGLREMYADIVSASFLLEHVTSIAGVCPGMLYATCLRLLVPLTEFEKLSRQVEGTEPGSGPYETGAVSPMPPMSVQHYRWQRDLQTILNEFELRASEKLHKMCDPFLEHVAQPLFVAWQANRQMKVAPHFRKIRNDAVAACADTDWKLACTQWLERNQDA